VSSGLPSREQAIQLLQKQGCPPKVVRHCEEVAALAVEIAGELCCRGLKINLQLVEDGALLHDIGRAKTHRVDHGLVGSKIVESQGLPQPLVNIVKRHVGGGITAEEAENLGWPKDNYVPETLEEKIVSYADKRIDKHQRVPIDVEIERLKPKYPQAAEKVRKLHEEIRGLLEN
jgi:uncharacterized protein